jgi:hypothetical protein
MGSAMRGVHICRFTARRVMPKPDVTKTHTQPWGEVVTYVEKGERMGRCENEQTQGRRVLRCTRKAVGFAVYVWGSVELCEKHLDEECPETRA